MNQQFESMPFEFEMDGGLEMERGRSRPAARQGATKARQGKGGSPRKTNRSPRGPRGPYHGGLFPVPFPYPYPLAQREPEPVWDDEPDSPPDGQGEMPPTLAGAISRLPAAMQPTYAKIGSVLSALDDSRATGPGFYLIEFTVNNQLRAYSGQTGDLRRRLQQHALCGHIMGLPLAGHIVYVARSALSDAQRRAIEWRLHDDMFRNQRGMLTNQRRELEVQLLGKEWA